MVENGGFDGKALRWARDSMSAPSGRGDREARETSSARRRRERFPRPGDRGQDVRDRRANPPFSTKSLPPVGAVVFYLTRVTTTLIGNIETLKRFPSAENLDRIAAALEVPDYELFMKDPPAVERAVSKFEVRERLEQKVLKAIEEALDEGERAD